MYLRMYFIVRYVKCCQLLDPVCEIELCSLLVDLAHSHVTFMRDVDFCHKKRFHFSFVKRTAKEENILPAFTVNRMLLLGKHASRYAFYQLYWSVYAKNKAIKDLRKIIIWESFYNWGLAPYGTLIIKKKSLLGSGGEGL